MTATPETLVVEPVPQPPTPEAKPAPAAESTSVDPTQQVAAAERLYLIGRPTLKEFIRYVRGHAVNPPGEGTLAAEWQAAREVVRALEDEEAGLADGPTIRKIGLEYEWFLTEFLKDPLIRHGFNTVPTEVAFVELDRLVVYQKHIDLSFVRELENKLGPAPSEEQVFRTCLPFDHPQPPVKWSRVHGDKYVFV